MFLWLLLARRECHPACKNLTPAIPKVFIDKTTEDHGNHGKMIWVTKSRVGVYSMVNKPCSVWRHWPVVMFHTLTVESALPDTRMFSRSSMPLVKDWWPISVWRHAPVSALHTRIDVSNEPLTMWTPSNCLSITCIPLHQLEVNEVHQMSKIH